MTTWKMQLAGAMILLLGAGPALAQETDVRLDQLLGEHDTYADAFELLQQAVTYGDPVTVAAMVAYPITVTVEGEATTIETEEDFIALYDEIITPAVAEAVTGQDYESLFVNAEGTMLGDGEVWLGGVCQDEACSNVDVRILAINN